MMALVGQWGGRGGLGCGRAELMHALMFCMACISQPMLFALIFLA